MTRRLVVGIDGTNIRDEGGVTHLVELLKTIEPRRYGFHRVIVWACKSTLDHIENWPWLDKYTDPILSKNIIKRAFWQCKELGKFARKEGCDLLFVPGGSFCTDFKPIVTMSRNLLPFDWLELKRFGLSMKTLRYLLLYFVQSISYNRANSLIFLTKYAREKILLKVKLCEDRYTIIPHGVNDKFFKKPDRQKPINEYNFNSPFRLIYVSVINFYKHQWNVALAISKLRQQGLPVVLDLIGPAYAPALKKLQKVLEKVDPNSEYIRHLEKVPHYKLKSFYHQADAFIFASSCENMPNILLEAMASGLPIASSDRGPMPEILRDGGVYFDPEDPDSIAQSVKQLITFPSLRTEKAMLAHKYSKQFSWSRCADETFTFLKKVAIENLQ